VPAASERISAAKPTHFLRWLWALWLATSVGRFLAGLVLHGPIAFGDEVLYWEMARNFHRFHNFNMELISGHLPVVLYSAVISPAFVWHPPRTVYLVVKLISCLLMASAVFPTYGLAREFLDEKRSLLAALLTALSAGGIYSALVMAENLFFPVFLLNVWLAFRTLDAGRKFDSFVTGVLFTIGFFVKIQTMFLAMAYVPVLLLWAAASLVASKGKHRWRSWILAATVRAVPVLMFGVMIGIRWAQGRLAHENTSVAIFGNWYSYLAQVSVHLDLARFSSAIMVMFVGLAISTLFAPLASLFLGILALRKIPLRFVLFWALTLCCTAVYLVMIARNDALYENRIRVYERYFFVLTPLLWIWFFVIRERLRSSVLLWTSTLVLAALCALCLAHYPPLTVIGWDSHTDSPTLTLFFSLIFPPTFMPYTQVPARIGFALISLLAFAGLACKRASRATIPFALALLFINFGWYRFERDQIAPTQVRPLQAVFKLKYSFQPKDQLAILYDPTLAVHDLMFCYFWWPNPMTLYGLGENPAWFGKRLPTRSGKPDFSKVSADYVIDIGQPDLDLPLVQRWDDPRISVYRNNSVPSN
jgi:Dolichyl-phosphate-mannose-protein mannosyltransferase